MTFLDDVDSLKAKVGIGSTSPLVLFGLSAVIIAVVLSIGFMAWGSFTSSGIVVEHSEKSTQSQEFSSSINNAHSSHVCPGQTLVDVPAGLILEEFWKNRSRAASPHRPGPHRSPLRKRPW